MRVKVKISSAGHLFGEEFIVDVTDPCRLSIRDVAEHFMRFGVVIGDRWISPFRLMEFSPTEEQPEGKAPNA